MPSRLPDTRAPVAVRPEEAVLLLCARTEVDATRSRQIERVLQDGASINWDNVLDLASRHGLMPLLYWHLRAISSSRVPEGILRALRNRFHANARHNLLLTHELLDLLARLDGHGIRAIPLKGPVLAQGVYGSLALRQFGDLDILVSRRDVIRARDLLLAWGYRPQIPLTGVQERAYLRNDCHYVLARADGYVMVELHWALTPGYFSFALDPAPLWERLESLSLAGARVPTLCPEDLLLTLCVHGSKHHWARLEWICGVAELLRGRPDIAWPRVTAQAAALGGERMLSLGLLLAQMLLDAPVPLDVARKAQADPAARRLAACARASLFRPPTTASTGEDDSNFDPYHLAIRERSRDKARYCLRFAVLPTIEDVATLALPAPLFPLYGLLRPLRLAGKHGRRLWRPLPGA